MVALDTPSRLISSINRDSARLKFTTIRPLALDQLGDLNPVEVAANGCVTYLLESKNTGPAIVKLVSAIERQENELLELQISRATLEDVFLEMTGKEIGK